MKGYKVRSREKQTNKEQKYKQMKNKGKIQINTKRKNEK
jgi:hypothetical protein